MRFKEPANSSDDDKDGRNDKDSKQFIHQVIQATAR